MTSSKIEQGPVVKICWLFDESTLRNNHTELITQVPHSLLKRSFSSGQSQPCISNQGLVEDTVNYDEHNKHKLQRENSYPGTDKPETTYPFVQFKASPKDISSKLNKDPIFKVLFLRCKMECFPLLHRNLKYAKDIQNRCQKILGDRNNVPQIPRILDQPELQLCIVTDSGEDDIERDVSVIMGNHSYNEITNVTERYFRADNQRVTLKQDCSCLILFLHKDVTNITVLESLKVLYVPSPSLDVEISGQSQSVRVFREDTVSLIRRKLTHILGADLFTYAEKVKQCMEAYETKMKQLFKPDLRSELQNTLDAVAVLLNGAPVWEASSAVDSTKFEIPDNVDSALNGMTDRGVMAFGLFADRFVVFLDENCEDKVQTETTKEILELCNKQSKFNLPVDVVTASQNFLNDTGLKQGDALLKSRTQIGSIGLVTKATKPMTKAADRPTTSQSEQETQKNIVVAITAGHLFKENDDAFFIENGEMKKFGKCLTSLHRSENASTMQYDIAVIEVDGNITTNEDYDVKFRNDSGESCDCILFKGTLACGSAVYKIGAATGMKEGVVVSSDFRLAGLVDTNKAYLIRGRDDRAFSDVGDSGSIVFTLDVNDEECRTVNLVSIATKVMQEGVTRGLGIPFPLSYSIRLDRCLEQLSELEGVTIQMPEK